MQRVSRQVAHRKQCHVLAGETVCYHYRTGNSALATSCASLFLERGKHEPVHNARHERSCQNSSHYLGYILTIHRSIHLCLKSKSYSLGRSLANLPCQATSVVSWTSKASHDTTLLTSPVRRCPS